MFHQRYKRQRRTSPLLCFSSWWPLWSLVFVFLQMQRLTDPQMAEARERNITHSSAFCIHHRFLCSVNISTDLILSTGWQMNFHSPHFADEEAGSHRFYAAFSCSAWRMELLWKVSFNPGVSAPKVGNSFRPGLNGPFLLYLPRCSAVTHRGAFPRETILPNTAHVCSVGTTVAWLFLGTLFLCTPDGQDNNRTKKMHLSIRW